MYKYIILFRKLNVKGRGYGVRDDKCRLCPRECGVRRDISLGYCGQSNVVKIARYQKHMWEEPCISGTGGSGTIFFSGCQLKCVYCQNFDVSRGMGREISEGQLADIFFEMQDIGCHNINLVTASHFTPQIIHALDMVRHKLKIPIILNSGGYESVETIATLGDYIDIFMPDFKYKDSAMAMRYSGCDDYYEVATKAIGEMLKLQPELVYGGDGMLKKGVIIRHLVLPGGYKDSLAVIDGIYENFGSEGFVLSIMSQYTPMPQCESFPEINRPITTFEYKKALNRAIEHNFDIFSQDRASSSTNFIPPFGEDDVKPK